MDLDLTGLWTWTVPLWGLGALVLFLVAIMMEPVNIITALPTTASELIATPAAGMKGGVRSKK